MYCAGVPWRRLVTWCSCIAVALCSAKSARASDFDVSWNVARDCPNRDQFRAGLSRLVGREVTFGEDAAVGAEGAITAVEDGYELDLRTWSHASSERRTLQARSCSELTRASLLITALLLSDRPGRPLAESESADEPSRFRLAARLRAIGDLGSISDLSLGPGVSIALGLNRTWLELGGVLFPPHVMRVPSSSRGSASIALLAASAGMCQEFFGGPTLGPCAHLEIGRLHGQARGLETNRKAGVTWISGAVGARASVELFTAVFATADLRAGLPWNRPQFAIAGVGTVHEVPPLFGRVELSLEGRF